MFSGYRTLAGGDMPNSRSWLVMSASALVALNGPVRALKR
jgi:hypothetical protein